MPQAGPAPGPAAGVHPADPVPRPPAELPGLVPSEALVLGGAVGLAGEVFRLAGQFLGVVSFLAGPFGGLLRPAGRFLGSVEPALRLPGRGSSLCGHLVRPRLLLGVGPAPGQVGGLGGHVGGGVRYRGGFLGPFRPLLSLIGPVLRLVGPPPRPLGEFLRLLGVRPGRRSLLAVPLLAGSLLAGCSPVLPPTALSASASFSTACLATLYGSPVSAIR